MTNAVIVICTRTESSRLPGKVFKKLGGVPALVHILRRVLPSGLKTILAVPYGQEDVYASFLEDHGLRGKVAVYGGDPESPLHRTAAVLQLQDPRPKYYVRITHDDALIDLQTMLDLLEATEKGGYGYGITPGIVEGAGVEVISTENLLQAALKHSEPTEFISWYVRGNVYNPKVLRMEPRASVRRGYRLTMDYREDALVLEAVLRAVGPEATLDRVVAYLDKHPSLLTINRQPLVSVYTAVRNGARWIGDALESSLADQDLENIEHIVVDDGSEDDTLAAVAPYAGDRRLKIVINDKRLYVAGSSNRAVAMARGKYVVRLDADDVLLTNALGRMVKTLEREGAMALYSGYHEIDSNGKVTARHQKPNLELAGGALMRRDWLNYYRFNDKLTHHDGIDFANRMQGQFKIATTQEVLWQYRVHPESHSRSAANQAERNRVKRALQEGSMA